MEFTWCILLFYIPKMIVQYSITTDKYFDYKPILYGYRDYVTGSGYMNKTQKKYLPIKAV